MQTPQESVWRAAGAIGLCWFVIQFVLSFDHSHSVVRALIVSLIGAAFGTALLGFTWTWKRQRAARRQR